MLQNLTLCCGCMNSNKAKPQHPQALLESLHRSLQDCSLTGGLFPTVFHQNFDLDSVWSSLHGEDSQSASTHPHITNTSKHQRQKPRADELAAAGLQWDNHAVTTEPKPFGSQQLSPNAPAPISLHLPERAGRKGNPRLRQELRVLQPPHLQGLQAQGTRLVDAG